MSIDLTEFLTKNLTVRRTQDGRHILTEDSYINTVVTIGCGRAYYTDSSVGCRVLKVYFEDDTFYVDLSAKEHVKEMIQEQVWILKHVKGKEYKIRYTCLWEKLGMPTIEELNSYAAQKQDSREQVEL